MKRTDSNTEAMVMDLYKHGKSMRTIHEIVNVSITTVMNILYRNGIQPRSKGGIEKLPQAEIVKKYQEGQSTGQLATEYGVTVKTMCDILKRFGIERDNRYKNVNLIRDYWKEIDTIDKAYFLGLMVTDGNLWKNQVTIELNEEDRYILERFCQQTQNENPIRRVERKKTRKDGSTHTSITCLTRVACKDWAIDLKQWGIIPHKTPTAYLPIISDDLMPHVIRGMIDGDGWITAKGHCIGFCGNETCVTQVRDFLVKTLNVSNVKVCKIGKNLWGAYWGGKKCIAKIGEYIYANKDEFYLTRKFDHYREICLCDRRGKDVE